MFGANGTEGLELFTWIVAGGIGSIAALGLAHFLLVHDEDQEEVTALDEQERKEVRR